VPTGMEALAVDSANGQSPRAFYKTHASSCHQPKTRHLLVSSLRCACFVDILQTCYKKYLKPINRKQPSLSDYRIVISCVRFRVRVLRSSIMIPGLQAPTNFETNLKSINRKAEHRTISHGHCVSACGLGSRPHAQSRCVSFFACAPRIFPTALTAPDLPAAGPGRELPVTRAEPSR
jgi:hypothetical protein